MLSQTTWLPTLLLIISLTVYTVESDSHVTVRPTDSNSSICGDSAICDTLSNLISSNPAIFSDGSDLSFLEGEHVVIATSAQLKIGGNRNVTWNGRGAVITCKTPTVFVFSEVRRLEIKQLTLSKCGEVINDTQLMLQNVSAALFLNNVHTLHLTDLRVNDNTGYGLFISNLYGSAKILNSSFLDNHGDCKLPFSNCTGGNIAMHFFDRASSLDVPVTISIVSCTIRGGSDLSQTHSNSCEERQEMPSSSSALRANGLAVILAQHNYQVSLSIDKTLFFNNTGDKKHPAVLVHDYSSVTNNVHIQNSFFEENGNVLASLIENGKNSNMKVSFETKFFTIRNCSFKRNDSLPEAHNPSGIHICVRAANLSHTHFHTVTIADCKFFNYYIYEYKEANIKITYSFPHSNNFPRTLIEVERCTFSNSSNPLLINLTDLPYLDSTHYYPSLVTIKHSQFGKRSYFALLMHGPQDWTHIIPWKISSKNIGVIGISNCTFSSAGIQVSNLLIVLRDCRFYNYRWGPAVEAKNTVVAVTGQNVFQHLSYGFKGGALSLFKSILLLMPNSHTNISENIAGFGGGIFATSIETDFSKADVGIYSFCTITRSTNTGTAHIAFEKNQARRGGNSIFGGNYTNCTYNCTGRDQCRVIPDTDRFDYQHLPEYISITPYSNDTRSTYTEVSSPANRICLCENNEPTSECDSHNVSAFPGEEFNVSLIALGELNGSEAVIVTARLEHLPNNNQVYYSQKNCANFSYAILNYSTKIDQTINLSLTISHELCRAKQHPNFSIMVQLTHCPPGLQLSSDYRTCECLPFLKKLGIQWNKKKNLFLIKDKQWIGYYKNRTIAVSTGYPLDYLNSNNRSINLSQPEEQCNFNRHGTLCGACQNGYSIVLGTSNCMECSNVYLLLSIPFALAGVALVVLLLKCNLTVSVGHINGIIFYANIVQVNKDLLFPNQGTAYKIFSTFIAWLNLDLGIETCFFENMDSYGKVWLQFVFPVYLWILIALIIIFTKYFQKLGRLISSNYVPVLATLFLLSYAKLLRTVFATMSFTFLGFGSQSNITVWLVDGNIDYFSSKHVPLIMVAVVFAIFYILPLTLLVLLAPCLQAKSHHKAFKWVNRLKPFLDAYQGPYSDKFRYWTGLLLILRVLLSLIDETNYENDPSINFLCTFTTITPLVVLLIAKQVYRQRLANRLELLSLLNIMILFFVSWLIATIKYNELKKLQYYPTYISVTVMMLALLGVILYQLVLTLCPTVLLLTSRDRAVEQSGTVSTDKPLSVSAPTSSVVELEDCVELKEPLLDSD